MNKNKRRRKTADWSNRQQQDPFVKKAKASGYRARSVFKLEQIDQKYKLITANTFLIDLGSAPGSWSQYAVTRVRDPGQVVAVDLLQMDNIPGVNFILGDFTDQLIMQQVLNSIGGNKIDLVLSDMAPNITGIRVTDQAKSELIQEAIISFCDVALRPGGNLLTKIFEGEAAVTMRKNLKNFFQDVVSIKPEASRSQSKEIFLLGRQFKGLS